MSPIVIATTAFVLVVIVIYALGTREGFWPGPRELALFKREARSYGEPEEAVEGPTCPDIHGYECADDDCECECHDDETDEFPEDSEKAVEVPLSGDDLVEAMLHFDWIGYREWQRAKLRAECPRLYSDNWYAQARADFSARMVEQYTLMAQHRKDMGLAA